MMCAAGCEEPAGQYGLCSRCEHLLAGTCLGKKRHWRAGNAQRAATWGADEVAYQCEVCGLYHVGHTGGHSEQLQATRLEVIRNLRQRGNGALLTQLAERWRGVNRYQWKARREGTS